MVAAHLRIILRLTGYPGTVRQLVVTGLGHDAPTVIITCSPAIVVVAGTRRQIIGLIPAITTRSC